MANIQAGIYARKSTKDEEAEQGRLSRSVTQQLEDTRALAARLGWTIVREYPEDDTSAFKKRTVTLPDGRRVRRNVRPVWNEMLDDLYHGRITALVAYDLDRAMREPRDLEDLIEVVEQRQRQVESVTGSLRLTNDTEILAARIGVSVANKSSRDTSRRVKASMPFRVKSGAWHGGLTPFGFRVVGGTVVERRNGSQRVSGGELQLDPVEAPLLQDAAKRVLRGESLYAITAQWNRDGVATRTGKHWRTSTLMAVLLRPMMIGMREWQGNTYPAQWPAVLDRRTWDRLRALTKQPSRRFHEAGPDHRAGVYALGGLARCGKVVGDDPCGSRLIGQRLNGSARLICHPQADRAGCGGVAISYAPLEDFVLRMLLARLDSPEFRASMAVRATVSDGAEDGLRDELRVLDERRLRVADNVEIGAYTKGEARARLAQLADAREKIEAELRTVARRAILADVATGDDARALWASADLTRRQRFLREFIDGVDVAPHPSGHPTHLTRRRGESDDDLDARRREHTQDMLRRRVKIRWSA